MVDERDKLIFFPMSFNEQMAQIDTEIDRIITHGSRSKISEMGREAYGEPGCASSIKLLFDIIKADLKNEAMMDEICKAERDFTAYLFDEPNAPSEQEISAYWKKNFDAYIAEIQQH